MVKTKSIFDPAEKSDGLRVLITRFIPGYPNLVFHRHYPELAPSYELLASYKGWGIRDPISWKEYTSRFMREMESHESDVVFCRLANLSAIGRIFTLLCFEREGNPHCHRHIVKCLIEDRGG